MKINYTTHPPLTYLGAIHALLQKYGFKIGSCKRLWYNGKGEVLALDIYPENIFVRRINSWRIAISVEDESMNLIDIVILEQSLKELP